MKAACLHGKNWMIREILIHFKAGEEGKCCINSYSPSEELKDLLLPTISTSGNGSIIYFSIFLWFKR